MASEDADTDVQTQETQLEKAVRWDPFDNKFDPHDTENTYYLSWHFRITPCFDRPEPCYLLHAQNWEDCTDSKCRS